jgi:hypothetical protein
MQERSWLFPSVGLTFLAGAVALLLIPSVSGLLPALAILPAWMAAAGLISGLYGFAWMMSHGIDRPTAEVATYVSRNWRKLVFVALVILLAGLNMIAFMWVKPLLNYLIPFSADPMLASWDRVLFLGHEPWRTLSWLNFPGAGLIYHPVWFIVMIASLLIAATAPASPSKSAVLLNYFVLWSLAGPVIHTLLPAAGPVFYERLGYGLRFAGLDGGPEATAVADYLWSIYANQSFGAGSGISAMPSMHVTISSWVVIVFQVFARRWLPIALAAWLLIFLLSISLGWHYALDGVVGTATAITCHFALLKIFRMTTADSADRAMPVPARDAAFSSRAGSVG